MNIPFLNNSNTTQNKFDQLSKITRLEQENDSLRREIKNLTKEHDYIDIDIGDPDLEHQSEREDYVAKVAGLHDHILNPKLKKISSVIRAQISNPTQHGLDDTETNIRILQGADYSIWELIRWGKKIKSEHMSYQEDEESFI
jgi:hypothetical protein